MHKFYKDAIERYEMLDEMLEEAGISDVEIIIIGGEAGRTLLGEDKYRSTIDIDFISEQDLQSETIKIITNVGLELVGVSETPPPEDMQKKYPVSFKNLTVYYPSIEDFALTKLMSVRGKDEEDLINYPILDGCNLKEIRERIEEYKSYIVSDKNPDYNFKKLDEYIEKRRLIE
ncbi:DUF6036 family nucleotidyltransferase [Salinicoccus roseus]|uniref:DUF6036 family nucleotidyltransferase n=1 Tax=Salinicoccus roseus TaxID=45670 RepID=UPI00230184BE|nr:DUF6036 family nucleotidyltransferase [Salinicoccus roseus]